MSQTLLDALRAPHQGGEGQYVYRERIRFFNATRDVVRSNIAMSLLALGMWLYVAFAILLKGNAWTREPLYVMVVVFAILFTGGAIYVGIFYARELLSTGRHLHDQIILDGSSIIVLSGTSRKMAEFVQLRRGSFMIYDMGTGLNTWRLHLMVDGQARFYDPSKMDLVHRPTPYPR